MFVLNSFLWKKFKKIILNEWDPIGIQDIPEAQADTVFSGRKH